ncbi:glycosyltransferase [Kineococcus aurantiacus]|uniref:Teichuronic acid biosynthesis glycosyltransferase TuaH n=1 Tax=Kineococcus aurantiacus TaxID=37633 RepID=A0A7Y9ATM5_9ACTN|nr:teichuronic acid biosynthesis glycosyltransferase TuaH [Kineococcus aurantiacus]
MSGRPLVVVLSSTAFEGHRLYEQRLAGELARTHDVLFVQPPTAVWTKGDGLRLPARRVPAPGGVRVVTPWVLPASRRRGLHHLNAPVVAATVLAAAVRERRRPRALASAQNVGRPLRALARAFGARTAFLVKDDYVAGAGLVGVPAERLRRGRDRSLALADEVVVVSPRLQRLCAAQGRQAHLVPAGAELTAPATAPLDLPAGPFAVFLGMVSDRIDLGGFRAVVAAGLDLVVVGPRQPTFTQDGAWRELLGHPRVHWLGPRAPQEVSQVLARASVGLMPYTLSEFNQASFPLKVLEYLAAGLPVVSTRLEALDWLDAPGVSVVDDLAADPAKFGEAAVAAAAGDDPSAADARREFAGRHTWAARGDRWRDLLGLS